MEVDIPRTFGALLVGAFVATLLSGIVATQSLAYFKLYPTDTVTTKSLVLAVWLLDTFHSGLICSSLWHYLVASYGQVDSIATIPWQIALSIITTAIVTFLVHCFLASRIFKLSKGKWILTAPVLGFAFLRLCAATVTGSEMMHLKRFADFKDQFTWVFTLGLALSSLVDVIITVSLCALLRNNRSSSTINLNFVIDSLMIYTLENGALTSIATIVSMIFWLAMQKNLIYLGLHFVIGKLYAISLLITLNMRRSLRRRGNSSSDKSMVYLSERGVRNRFHITSPYPNDTPNAGQISINVQKTIETNIDDLSEVDAERK